MIRRLWCALFHGHNWRVLDLRFLAPSLPERHTLPDDSAYDEKYGFTVLRRKCTRCGREGMHKLLGDWSQTPQYAGELDELRKMAGLGGDR